MTTRKLKYSEDGVLKSLRKKNDVKVNPTSKTIEVLKNDAKNKHNDLGNGSWGKIDFLTKNCGYKQFYVTAF